MLRILIIPESIQRGCRILDAVCKAETEPVTEHNEVRMEIRTKGARYTVVKPDAHRLMACRADQVILDFALVSKLGYIVDSILRDSCVPKEFQIIDDRKVLNGCMSLN